MTARWAVKWASQCNKYLEEQGINLPFFLFLFINRGIFNDLLGFKSNPTFTITIFFAPQVT